MLRNSTEEFYEVTELDWTVEAVSRQLRRWESTYNTIRPHTKRWGIAPRASSCAILAASVNPGCVTHVLDESRPLPGRPGARYIPATLAMRRLG